MLHLFWMSMTSPSEHSPLHCCSSCDDLNQHIAKLFLSDGLEWSGINIKIVSLFNWFHVFERRWTIYCLFFKSYVLSSVLTLFNTIIFNIWFHVFFMVTDELVILFAEHIYLLADSRYWKCWYSVWSCGVVLNAHRIPTGLLSLPGGTIRCSPSTACSNWYSCLSVLLA